ncbi:MAG: helix-turn-helix domain-containing protein [Pseudonocardiaceae bacterium]
MNADDAGPIGLALWRVRDERGQSLRVVAGLAGMSKDTLNRIETGQRSPTVSELQALADALQVSVSELTRLPVPAPANGHTDSTIKAIGLALDGIEVGQPGGMVLPVAALRDQVARAHQQRRACRFAEVATELPELIRNLHATLNTGTDHAELLELAVYLHVHVTRLWLAHTAAPTHLQRRIVFLARRLAQERDETSVLAVAGFGVVCALEAGGALDLARAELDSLMLPPATADNAGLVCNLTLSHAYAAVLDGRPGDAAAPMAAAEQIAERFGADRDTDSLGFVHAAADVGLHRMAITLEAGEPDQTVSIAEDVDPRSHPFAIGQAQIWRSYGRALTRLGGRRNDAVTALHRAEQISPHLMLRDPFFRDTLAVLLRHSRRDAADEELRGMARRAGLPG